MREFTLPKVDTRDKIGKIGFDYAFQIVARYDAAHDLRTPRGERIYQSITGGTVKGPKLNGKVYPDSGGDYGLLRADGVEDVNMHFMLSADDGEWIYVRHYGYQRRNDGYFRVAAYFDAEWDGPHAWLNDAVLIATAQPSDGGRQITYTYYEAV